MDFEELQKVWKSQDAGARVTIDADALLKVVRRNQQHFLVTIFWRDVREVGAAFLLAIYFCYRGLRSHQSAVGLVGLGCLSVGAFMIVDRVLQSGKKPAASDPLKGCVESSLRQVEHQIWLLENIFWWYLLPIVAPLALWIIVMTWNDRHTGGGAVIRFTVGTLICALTYWGVFWLNQFAVRKHLEPRRQELETLLGSLK